VRKYREVRSKARDPADWEKSVAAAIEALEKAELLVHPTSTVYGLGGAVNRALEAEVNRLKGRPRRQNLVRLAGSVETLRRELRDAEWDDRAERLATEFWPGPLTLVLEDGSEAGVAVRVDGHPLLLVILGRWRSLMTSTSLNRRGEAPATNGAGARRVLEALPEPGVPVTFLDAGSLPRSASSTIVSLRGGGAMILREGPIDRRRIARCLGEAL
jgi:L-threonylcarbamoyladenylate synthase